MSKLVYKYRGGNDEIFERDLKSLEENCFWASAVQDLNDPCETLVFTDNFKKQLKFFGRLIGRRSDTSDINNALEEVLSKRSEVGIYSLSSSYSHELLWAHYANNHKGFCIEYDWEGLTNKDFSFYEFHLLPVKYSSKPPQININDITSKNPVVFQKMAGSKSKAWSYEDEVRIMTDTPGLKDYDFRAVKAIYFGLRMKDEHKLTLMERLSGRGITYYQMKLEERDYSFKRELIDDPFKNSEPYLLVVQPTNENNTLVSYTIANQKRKIHLNELVKGTITIRLDHKITKSQLESLGKEIKHKLFVLANRIYIFYYLPGMIEGKGAWATTHFQNNEWQIDIQGISLDHEIQMFNYIKNDNREVIGRWAVPEYKYEPLRTLYKDQEKIYMESFGYDGIKLVDEKQLHTTDQGTFYQGFDGAYTFQINENDGSLICYSNDEFIKAIPPYENSLQPF